MNRNTAAAPLSLSGFNDALRLWLRGSHPGQWIGGSGFGGKEWVWVDVAGRRFRLNADATSEGVAAYLEKAETGATDEKWALVKNRNGIPNKVVFGRDRAAITRFPLYSVIADQDWSFQP